MAAVRFFINKRVRRAAVDVAGWNRRTVPDAAHLLPQSAEASMTAKSPIVSIIIPARFAADTLCQTLDSLVKYAYAENTEIIVVNDGSEDDIKRLASRYPVKILEGNDGGPAAARNIGVQSAQGRLLIFLDADCRVAPGWLSTHLAAHETFSGLLAVGGSICMESNARFWARCDHYCSWYNVTPSLPATWVPNHPAANLSVSRSTFECVGPFKEDLPSVGVHEEIEWQKRLLRLKGRIRFQPQAAVWHRDRDDLKSFVKHNFRWGYNSLEVKSSSKVSRFPWVYRRSLILILGFVPFAAVHTLYILICWFRVGKLGPFFSSPIIFIGCLTYAVGMAVGGIRLSQKRKTREN
jgi:glycosyltransferase involved in cell wall biosynthesis